MGILIITGNAASGIVGESVLHISVWAALFCVMLIIFGMYFVCRLIIRPVSYDVPCSGLFSVFI